MTELAGVQTPDPSPPDAGEAQRLSRWDSLRSADGDWPNLVGKSADRDRVISDLRELADFLEARPEIPVIPRYDRCPYTVFAYGTDAEKIAQVGYLATLLDANVRDETRDGGHCVTAKSFGGIEYQFVAIPKDRIDRPPAVFAVGQDVRLAPEVAGGYRRNDIPQAGVVVSCEPEGTMYQVRVPGRLTMSFPGSTLEPAGFGPVKISQGTVKGLADAEAALTAALARCQFNQLRGGLANPADVRDAETLASELARTCGLRTDVLNGLLEGMVETQIAKLQARPRTALRDEAALSGEANPGEPEAVGARRDSAAGPQRTSRRGR